MTRDELLARLNAPPPPPLDALADFLRSVVRGSVGTDEIEADLRRQAAYNPRPLDHWAGAINALLADPPTPGTLARMVAVDGNTVLADGSDAGAALWLQEMAGRIKSIQTETPDTAVPGVR